MTVFASTGRTPRLPRPWPAMAGSVAVHAAAAGALVALAGTASTVVVSEPETPLRFVHVLPPPPVSTPVQLPRLAREQLMLVDMPAPAVLPPPVPERIEARSEPAPPEPEPAPAPEAPIAPPRARAAPTVSVGAFDTAAARPLETARAIHPAGFDTAAARMTDSRTATAVLGGFDQGPTRSVAGSPRGTVVSDAGFGAGPATGGPGRGRTGTVVSGGFDASSGGSGTGTTPTGSVRSADFDVAPPQAAPAHVVRQAPAADTPLEILSKPTPAYTDDARARRIEGEVLLEVNFTATGELRVLRVVRGLGHGLDESAIRAATAIRFTPAQRDGRPVDFQTTLTIVFRLA